MYTLKESELWLWTKPTVSRNGKFQHFKYILIILLHIFRGDTFRESLLRIGKVRSLLPHGVNVIALTATATAQLVIQYRAYLGRSNPS